MKENIALIIMMYLNTFLHNLTTEKNYRYVNNLYLNIVKNSSAKTTNN